MAADARGSARQQMVQQLQSTECWIATTFNLLAKLPGDANDPAPKRPVLEFCAYRTLVLLSEVRVGVRSVEMDGQRGAAAFAGHGVNDWGVVRHVSQLGRTRSRAH